MKTVAILSAHTRRCSLLVATCLILSATMAKGEPMTDQQAHAIGVDAYLHFYSLVGLTELLSGRPKVTPQQNLPIRCAWHGDAFRPSGALGLRKD